MEEYVNKLVENTLKKENAKEIIVERILWYEMKLLEKDEEIERLNNIINKAREYLKPMVELDNDIMLKGRMLKPVLEILEGEEDENN